MLPFWNGKQQEERWYREKSSRSREEPLVAFLVVSNPPLNRFLWNVTDRRQVIIGCMESSQEKSNQLPLLLDRQNFGGLLDLKERTHKKNILLEACLSNPDCPARLLKWALEVEPNSHGFTVRNANRL